MGHKYKYSELSGQIIQAFYKVYNTLGYGFLEKVYENALLHELTQQGFDVVQQKSVTVFYDGTAVGAYFADLVVNNSIILEIKTAENISSAHEAQIINYLRATDINVGLILNFCPKPKVVRKIYDWESKTKIKNL